MHYKIDINFKMFQTRKMKIRKAAGFVVTTVYLIRDPFDSWSSREDSLWQETFLRVSGP